MYPILHVLNLGKIVKKEDNEMCENHFNTPTLTTGPFLVPGETGVGFPINRLIAMFKNPTTFPLRASLIISSCPPIEQGGTLPFIFNSMESVIDSFDVVIPPMSCTRVEINIEDLQNSIIRVRTAGDYKICNCEPAYGKLEISITGGNGNILPSSGSGGEPLVGLLVAEPTLFFHYKDFVTETLFPHKEEESSENDVCCCNEEESLEDSCCFKRGENLPGVLLKKARNELRNKKKRKRKRAYRVYR